MLILGEHKYAAELGEGADPGPQLPSPIVPFGGRSLGIEAAIKGPGLRIDGEAESFLSGGRLDRGSADIFLCGRLGNRGGTSSLVPRRRAKIAPSQELEIHRYLIAALQTGPRRPQWLRPSNGPAGFLFRRSLFFVKRKADEYCEQPLNVQYTTLLREWITEQLKKKNEVLLVFDDRIIEEKQKHREANACVFTRASLR
jgi:hypothetical protein